MQKVELRSENHWVIFELTASNTVLEKSHWPKLQKNQRDLIKPHTFESKAQALAWVIGMTHSCLEQGYELA